MRRLVVAAIAVTIAAVIPAAASAETFKGRTSQGRTATLVLRDDGSFSRFVIGWRGRCDEVDGPYRGGTRVNRERSDRDITRFTGTGKYVEKQSGGIRSSVTTNATGRKSGKGWSGTFEASVVVRRSGKLVDRCRTGRVTWTASPT